ncbi:GRIP and coiled-coil domain-containing protein 2 [Sarcoptes scabiei]|uniref:GRIP and coiled-coil domain-containing protein 2 n=1 Tax=Sarcoptes scabiei TaxID=52283 RepID=A0A834VBC6_SARSC|nr:GRIP and coiled-coil domain-containing protein 2 [Sarcoptes scabiei]
MSVVEIQSPNSHEIQELDNSEDIKKLQQKLVENEDKLLKFKSFICTLRNERNSLREKVSEQAQTIEQLQKQIKKSSTNQLFQNYQTLQHEYDNCQDDIEKYKKTTKNLESNLLKCQEEKEQLEVLTKKQNNDIDNLKKELKKQKTKLENQKDSIHNLESKIIILESQVNDGQIKVQNYETNAEEIKQLAKELKSKEDQIQTLTKSINEQSARIEQYKNQIDSNQESLEKFERLKTDHSNLQSNFDEQKILIEKNEKKISMFNEIENELKSKIDQLKSNLESKELVCSEKIAALELDNVSLQNRLNQNEIDLQNNKKKFDEYRSKVSNVLKANQINNCDFNRTLESLNSKIDNLEDEVRILRIKNEELANREQNFKEENITAIRKIENLTNSLNDYEELKMSLKSLREENEKLNLINRKLQISFAEEKKQIIELNKENLVNLKINYESKLKDLEEELNRRQISDDSSNSVVNSNTSFEEIKDENSSFQSNVSSLEKNFLETILSNTNDLGPSKSSSTINGFGGLTVDNLTHLLEESETSISLLTEQNRMLKEEIRRLHRNIDRLDIANNLEYLKNILLKFLTIKRHDEKEQLIGVLTTILKLTSEESAVFREFIPDNLNKSANSWNLWQWS